MNPYGKCSLIAEKFTAQAAIIEFSILSYPLEYWFCKLKTTKTKHFISVGHTLKTKKVHLIPKLELLTYEILLKTLCNFDKNGKTLASTTSVLIFR